MECEKKCVSRKAIINRKYQGKLTFLKRVKDNSYHVMYVMYLEKMLIRLTQRKEYIIV